MIRDQRNIGGRRGRRTHGFAAGLILCVLLGCVPRSEYPLSAPGSERLDPAIFGTWAWNEENESGYVHIGRDDKTGLLRIVMVEFHQEGELRVSEFSGHTSAVGGGTYLNLKQLRPPEAEAGYHLVKYRAAGDTLGIALMGNEPVEKAVQGGELKGVVEGEGGAATVRVTEDREGLRSFVVKKDADLFKEMNYLRKVNRSPAGTGQGKLFPGKTGN